MNFLHKTMINRAMIGIILMIFISGLILGCAQQTEKKPSMTDFKFIKNPERKIYNTLSIVMPQEWTEVEFGNALIYLPPGSEVMDYTTEKVTAAVSKLPDDTVSLENMIDAAVEETRKIMPDLTMIGQEPAKLGQLEGIKFRFTASVQNQPLIFEQVTALSGGYRYSVGLSCKKDQCQHTDIYQEMVQSFEPIEQKS